MNQSHLQSKNIFSTLVIGGNHAGKTKQKKKKKNSNSILTKIYKEKKNKRSHLAPQLVEVASCG